MNFRDTIGGRIKAGIIVFKVFCGLGLGPGVKSHSDAVQYSAIRGLKRGVAKF